MNGIREIPVAFGPAQSLFGVVATPANGERGKVACLMFNADATHRVGSGRIHVKLARQLAERGVTSLRFDLSGRGDSDAAYGAEHALTQGVQDLQAAMDQLEAMLGIHRFIVIGLRTGARPGLGLAVADARVIGLLMFDGFAFPGRRSRWDRRLRRMAAIAARPSAIAGTLQALARRPPSRAAVAASAPFGPDRPEITMALFRRSMTQLAERGVAVLLLYSGSVHVVDHDRDQLGPLAHEPGLREVDYRFMPGIDQGLISIAAQQSFMAVVGDWVLRLTSRRATARPERLARPALPVERVVLRTA